MEIEDLRTLNDLKKLGLTREKVLLIKRVFDIANQMIGENTKYSLNVSTIKIRSGDDGITFWNWKNLCHLFNIL